MLRADVSAHDNICAVSTLARAGDVLHAAVYTGAAGTHKVQLCQCWHTHKVQLCQCRHTQGAAVPVGWHTHKVQLCQCCHHGGACSRGKPLRTDDTHWMCCAIAISRCHTVAAVRGQFSHPRNSPAAKQHMLCSISAFNVCTWHAWRLQTAAGFLVRAVQHT